MHGLRRDFGIPIGASHERGLSGYYLIETAAELEETRRLMRLQAVTILRVVQGIARGMGGDSIDETRENLERATAAAARLFEPSTVR